MAPGICVSALSAHQFAEPTTPLPSGIDGTSDLESQPAQDSNDEPGPSEIEPRILRGRYILEAEIGRGGVGTVYRALDLNRAGLPPQHHRVALKVLGEQASRRLEAVQALRCEYHQAQLLSHPGVVNVFDFDHDGDTYFVTMELVDGESLGELMRRLSPDKVPTEAAMRILDELGQAIAHAHDRGVLHLDLKPDNVMIDAQGHVRVLDFGIAQPRMAEPNGAVARPASPAATPAYASCERLIQEQPDVRDDIFSFSCLAYELLAGTHPFDRCSALNARKDGRKAHRIPGLSDRQWATLQSGLAWACEDRPASMRAMLRGLAAEPNAPVGTPTRQATWWRVAALAMVVLGSAAMFNRTQRQDGARQADRLAVVGREPGASFDSSPVTRVSALETESARAIAELRSLPASAQSEARDLDSSRIQEPQAPRAGIVASEASAAARRTSTSSVDVVGFSRHSFSVSEADPVVHVNVRRAGGANSGIAFRWYTVDDSAAAGRDYVYGFGEVEMAPGQTTATLDVPIVADSIREDPEILQVIIGSSSGAQVGPARRAPVIIVDDD